MLKYNKLTKTPSKSKIVPGGFTLLYQVYQLLDMATSYSDQDLLDK